MARCGFGDGVDCKRIDEVCMNHGVMDVFTNG